MKVLDRYKVIGKFECCGMNMVIIRADHGTHVMESDEWELMKRSLGWSQSPTGARCFRKENDVA